MRIVIGADHRGKRALDGLEALLRSADHEVIVLGEAKTAMCDYPDMAYPVAKAVAEGTADCGVLFCGSGIGMSIAANKVDGVRAALVHDEYTAELARRHNDANVICLAADLLGSRVIERIFKAWVATPFEGGRHARRNEKIAAMEQGLDPRALTMDGGPPGTSCALPTVATDEKSTVA